MTVSTQTLKRTYVADGTQREWGVDFPVRTMEDVQIFVTDLQQHTHQITANFAVSESARCVVYPTEQSGLAPLLAGARITLVRATPLTQEIDLIRQGEWDAEVLEEGLDKLTLLAQELEDKVNRSVVFSPGTENPPTLAEHWEEQFEQTATHAAQAVQSAQVAQAQAQAASQSEQTAGEAASVAYAAASNAQESKTQALQAATQASDVLQNIRNRQSTTLYFTAGTAEGDYTGSLTSFPTNRQLTDLAIEVYVNGVRKHAQKPQEYTLSDGAVVFGENLVQGDSVVIVLNGRLTTGNEPATTSIYGVVQLATAYDALAGTDEHKAITPYTLQQKIDDTVEEVEQTFQTGLSAESSRAQTQETSLAQAISAEAARAQAAESVLNNSHFARQFIQVNTVVAQGTAGISGTYTLADLPDDNTVHLALFECVLQLSNAVANHSSMALATDVVSSPVIVCGTNNSFTIETTVLLPIKRQVSISFPSISGGVEGGTQVRFIGYL